MGLLMKSFLVLCIEVCIVCFCRGGDIAGDSFTLKRLHLTDEAVLGLLRRVETLESGRSNVCAVQGWCVVFDFEAGVTGWTTSGKAFKNQPTWGDNPTARKRGQPSKHRGDWWIGSNENRPSEAHKPGAVQGDGPKGTMTSPSFVIKGDKMRFLIGGGCDMATERVELVVGGKAVAKAAGKCNETLAPHVWSLDKSLKGKTARLRLVDNSSSGWGHINFDHFEMFVSD